MRRFLVPGVCILCFWAGPGQAHENPSAQLSHLSRLLRANPDDPDLYLQRGESYRLDGEWLPAEADYLMARDLGADISQVAVCLAALAMDRGNPEGALESLQLVSGIKIHALLIQGRALRQLGRYGEAATVLEQAIAQSPRPRPEDYLELTEVIGQQGDQYIPRALEVLDAGILRLGPLASLTLAAARLEVRAGQFMSVLERLDSAPADLCKSPAWMAQKGEILMLAEFDLQAQAAFTEALSLLHSHPSHRRSTPASVSLEKKLLEYLNTSKLSLSGEKP